jgi:uncharacterized protein YciI
MLFAIQCQDAADAESLRERHVAEHKEYLKGQAGMLVLGGALLDRSGDPSGSLYVVNAKDLTAATAFSDGDPFTKHGVFGEITIAAMRKSHWHPEVAE